MKIRMLYPILCLFSKMRICHHNQDEFVDHQVSLSTVEIEIPRFPLPNYYFFVTHTRSAVETLGGVLNELNTMQKHPLPPSSRDDVRPTQHRPPPLAPSSSANTKLTHHRTAPPIPLRNRPS
jgi:hypothetical protein